MSLQALQVLYSKLTGLSARNNPSRNNRSISAVRITGPYSLALLLGLRALQTIGTRLLGAETVNPFELLNTNALMGQDSQR